MDYLNKFKNDGYLVIKNIFNNQEISKILNIINNVDKKNHPHSKSSNGEIYRLEYFMRNIPELMNILLKSNVLDILENCIESKIKLYKDKFIFKQPRSDPIEPHYDGIFKTYNYRLNKEVLGWYCYSNKYINYNICLDDNTIDNGCLFINKIISEDNDYLYNKYSKKDTSSFVNLQKLKEDKIIENSIPIICPKGSIIIFNPSCIHFSYLNMTENPRRNLYLTFNDAKDGDFYDIAKEDKELMIKNVSEEILKKKHEVEKKELFNFSNIQIKINPYKYIIISDFLNLIYLKTIDYYLGNLDKTLYVKEGVPQLYMNQLNKCSLKEDMFLKIKCQTEFNEYNKSVENAVEKDIKILKEPTGAQGINRCFLDKDNIYKYPLLEILITELTSNKFTEFLENQFNKDLSKTRLRVELLRNVKSHFLIPHCDCQEKKITLLIYCNMNNQPLDSGTDIYVKDGNDINSDSLKRSFDNFKKVDSVDFINNTALIFSPGDNTWHGLDKNKTHDDRRLLQINWVSEEYSVYPKCFPIN